MTKWTEFKFETKSIVTTNKVAKFILIELGKIVIDFFSYDSKIRPLRTRLIKDTLALLGHNKFKYKVYANGLSPNLTQLNGGTFRNSEWLYDLHWYVEGKNHYTTTSLPLIMECEWQQKRKGDRIVPYSGIKYDFQKLLVSNAELRLMIFKIVTPIDLDLLTEYFLDNINNYKHLEAGSEFLFVAFYEKNKTFYYYEIRK